jgi:CRISPR-associated endonuclease/helicase Cas3
MDQDDDQQDSEQRSFTDWKTLACHTLEVAAEVKRIAEALNLDRELQDLLELAAVFHDWGKSHPAFQNMLIRKRNDAEKFKSFLLAKSKKVKPSIRAKYFADEKETDERCGYRHELASALGLFAILQTYAPQHPALLGPWSEMLAKLGKSPVSSEPQPAPSPLVRRLLHCSPEAFDLVAYLVASHHGKVRVGLHAAPKDQEYRVRPGDIRGLPIRGIREGDRLPSVALIPGEPPLPEVTLTLSPAALGLSERTGISWRERCLGVMERYGPAGLAFLEAILRAADVRASRLKTNDPAFAAEANP